ncbi:MAG: hypothetical protein FJ253_11985 [Phycisphaerae bacterium]|nr:hypothetical protein [Phycisphaerae bacterium]
MRFLASILFSLLLAMPLGLPAKVSCDKTVNEACGCCGEGCCCEPGECRCHLSSAPRDDDSSPMAPARGETGGSRSITLGLPSAAISIEFESTVGAMRAQATLDAKAAIDRSGRSTLLRSGTLRN